MRSLLILLGACLLFSALISCQAGVSGLPLASDNLGNGGNVLSLNITGPVDESVVRSNPVTVSGNTDPSADVMINGLSVSAENGHFSVMVELEPGPNMIDVSVKDNYGNQASKYLTVVYVP